MHGDEETQSRPQKGRSQAAGDFTLLDPVFCAAHVFENLLSPPKDTPELLFWRRVIDTKKEESMCIIGSVTGWVSEDGSYLKFLHLFLLVYQLLPRVAVRMRKDN